MNNRLTIGTISNGTLRPEDLLPALAYELESVATAPGAVLDNAEMRIIREARDIAARLDSGDEDNANDEDIDDVAAEIVCELLDYLQGFAPPYCRVGAHEGDGADIGVWPDIEALDMAIHDGDVLALDHKSDTDTEALTRADYAAIYFVNDHGNATLYVFDTGAEKWREAWSAV